jgi:cytochrome c556
MSETVAMSETQAVVEEVRKTRDTAARLANGDYPEDADHIRVLAGMIQKLAEQVERLAGGQSPPAPAPGPEAKDAEAAVEEDQTPQDAPADPINQRG